MAYTFLFSPLDKEVCRNAGMLKDLNYVEGTCRVHEDVLHAVRDFSMGERVQPDDMGKFGPEGTHYYTMPVDVVSKATLRWVGFTKARAERHWAAWPAYREAGLARWAERVAEPEAEIKALIASRAAAAAAAEAACDDDDWNEAYREGDEDDDDRDHPCWGGEKDDEDDDEEAPQTSHNDGDDEITRGYYAGCDLSRLFLEFVLQRVRDVKADVVPIHSESAKQLPACFRKRGMTPCLVPLCLKSGDISDEVSKNWLGLDGEDWTGSDWIDCFVCARYQCLRNVRSASRERSLAIRAKLRAGQEVKGLEDPDWDQESESEMGLETQKHSEPQTYSVGTKLLIWILGGAMTFAYEDRILAWVSSISTIL